MLGMNLYLVSSHCPYFGFKIVWRTCNSDNLERKVNGPAERS